MANDWRETVEAVLTLQKDGEMDTSPGPGLQWYPAQWMGDPAVQLMDMTAAGIHHHLLMVAWKGFDLDDDPVPCSLPDDPPMLKALCKHPATWDEAWPQVLRAWRRHEGRLWNIGLCRSYLQQMSRRRKCKGSADARWNAEREKSERNANASTGDANASGNDAKALDLSCSSSSSSSSSSFKDNQAQVEDSETAARALKVLAGGQDPIGRVRVDYGTVLTWLAEYRRAAPRAGAERALLDDLAAVAVAGHGLKGSGYIWTMLEPLIAEGECGNLADRRKPAWKKEKEQKAPRLRVLKPGRDPYQPGAFDV